MIGGRAACGDDCLPCETDCKCVELKTTGGFDMKLVNVGCCDCMLLGGFIVWNFGGITNTFYPNTPGICIIPPGPYVYPPVAIPDWLAAAIAAHGGVQQVELYANHCPDAGGIPSQITDDWPNGAFLLSTAWGGALCNADHIGTELCVPPGESGECDYEVPEDVPSALCWVLRGNDEKVIIQCSFCFSGRSIVIPPCPESSSSSSDSSSEGDSSSSSSSSLSSAGDPPLPPGSSSSSSSSSSGSPPEIPSSSSSSSSALDCYCDITAEAWNYGCIESTPNYVEIFVDANLSFIPAPDCDVLEGTGAWSIAIKDDSRNIPGLGPISDSLIVECEPGEEITVTVSWIGTAGTMLGKGCQTTFTVIAIDLSP